MTDVALTNVTVYRNHSGIRITGSQARDNTVVGSRIGTDTNLATDRNEYGLAIDTGAHHNIIGAQGAGNLNVISGNHQSGVEIFNAHHNTLNGNYIGTASNGTATPATEQSVGVEIRGTSTGNYIGGSVATNNKKIITPANVISGNKDIGVRVRGTGQNYIQGNFIGTDKTGDVALGNGGTGVGVEAPGTTVGGQQAGNNLTRGNVISANGGPAALDSGVLVDASNVTVSFNKIGTGNTPTVNLGNRGIGVSINNGHTGTRITDNVINFNLRNAIIGPRRGTKLQNNTQVNNGGLGIDLDFAGVTPAGMPVLTAATSNGTTTTVTGTLSGTPLSTFAVEIYGNMMPDADPDPNLNGYGEGEVYLGTIEVTTSTAGSASFTGTVPLAYGMWVTATATDLNPDGDGSSEFAYCIPVTFAPPPPPGGGTPPGTASVGSWVWLDSDGDGQRESGEAMVAGVLVTLTNITTGQTWVTMTDSLGHYLFNNLAAGDYQIHFALPAGYGFTDQHQGDPNYDSDADQLTGNTQIFSLGDFEFNLEMDAGLVLS